jgi:hypothetical protein
MVVRKAVKISAGNPQQVRDWKASADAVYDRKTLYDYMDGGAEVYLAYDFREVFVRKYADPGGNELALDIYDMGSPAEAFGMFSFDRQDPDAGIGQGSEYGPGLLRFWRGRYFVSVTVSGNEDKAELAVLELGKAVAPLLGRRRPAGHGQASRRPGCWPKRPYFHNHIHLSRYSWPPNVLNLTRRPTACSPNIAWRAGSPPGCSSSGMPRPRKRRPPLLRSEAPYCPAPTPAGPS